MSENDAGIEINVEVPDVTPPPEPVTVPAVTVIDAGNDAGNSAVESATIDHEGRLVRIETALELILEKLTQTDAKADEALAADVYIAESVEQVREEIAEVAEDAQEEPEQDEAPNREHPFYRSRKIFGKAD